MNLKKNIYSALRKVMRVWCKHTVKVNPRIIVFSSYIDYTDNSRALSDYLLENGYADKYDIYWKVNDAKRCRALHPNDKVHFFEDKNNISFKAMKLFYSAAWQFESHNMYYYEENHPANQHFIYLWHGSSYKDKDSKIGNTYKFPCDKVLVAGPLFIDTKSYFWNIEKDRIIAKGYPRYDWLQTKTDAAQQLYNKLLGENNKVVIWMPTFRNDKRGKHSDSNTISQFPVISTDKEWTTIDKWCHENKVVLLVKLHPFQKDYPIAWDSFSNIMNIDNSIFDEAGTTMYSFLAVTDGLISDYSSVAVDYMIVNKPLAFTLDDYKLYKDSRGFVVPNVLDFMPGHHVYNIEDLKCYIKDVAQSQDPYASDRKNLMGTLVHSSKCYCKEILETLNF